MPGLRERKKEQTRHQISAAARRLFFERGYDAVTVAEVAEEADVSEATVFNYFRTKEGLFFSGMDSYEAELVDAVRQRASGEPVLSAFRRHLLANLDRLSDRRATQGIAAAAKVIRSSADLQTKEREVLAHHTKALAAAIADDLGGDREVQARVVATALMGVHVALVDLARTLALGGVAGGRLAKAVEAQAVPAFDRLERGLRDFGLRPDDASSRAPREPEPAHRS
ncbi:MAG: TetR/AcrR family transcriptional regulator [Actinomycetota bacterium]|nr:TetR/AcrR family transcriptional regulator [Actinomycetota bacterium]